MLIENGDIFYSYIMGFLEMLTGFHYYVRFLEKKTKRTDYFVFAALGLTVLITVRFGNFAQLLIYAILLTVGGVFVYCAGGVQSALYAVVTVEIMQLCFGIFNSVLSIGLLWLIPIDGGIVSCVGLAFGVVALAAAVFCYRIIHCYFLCDEIVKNQYALMLFIPMLMIFLMDESINSAVYGSSTVVANEIWSGENGRNVNHYQMLLIQLLGLASLFCVMFAYKKLLENFHLSTELSLLEQEEHSLIQYVEEAKTHYEKTRSFRHDIKNHIIMLKALLQNNRMDQALDYIGGMEDITRELSAAYSTNNPVVDILIGNKLGIAEELGIQVECALLLPVPCAVRDIDFCIILSNALDNAIRACKEMEHEADRFIHVTGNIQGAFIMLEIENSFQGNGHFQKGIGLSNVKAVAEKYQGAISIQAQNGIFMLSVLLINVNSHTRVEEH